MLDTYHAFQLFDEMLIQLKSSAEEMHAIIKGLEKVRQELDASANDGPVYEVFHKTPNQFISIVELEVGSVTNLVEMLMHWHYILVKILLVALLNKQPIFPLQFLNLIDQGGFENGESEGLGLHIISVTIFLVATISTCLGVQTTSEGCFEHERLALLKFKHSVKDDLELLSSWVVNDCCRWERIHCDSVTGHVDSLFLRGMSSSFPPNQYYLDPERDFLDVNELKYSLADLRHLKYLDLSGNYFGGSRIPEFIGSFKQLVYLNLSHVGFEGIIPHHFGNLSNLKVLDLSSNYGLVVDDMAWTYGLSSLEHLDLSSLYLSGAHNLHMVFFMIPSLKELSLSYCGLSNVDLDPLLNSSRMIPNIKHLDLGFNNFEGPLPAFFKNMTSLAFLDLSNFNLSLAWNFANLLNMIPSLSKLYLSSCGLDKTFLSPLHLNFSTLSNIQHLDLSKNSIEGTFPSVLTNMSCVSVLDHSGDKLNSSVPSMPNLLELELSSNKFKKIEQIGIWRLCRLKKLSASFNNFDKEMSHTPTNTSECSQYALKELHLSFGLNGTIPDSFRRLVNLRNLHRSSNGLTGPMPDLLRKLRFLEVLDISNNKLTGPISAFHGKLSKLDLSFNQLNDSIPDSLGKLASLTDLYIRNNRLTGPIPASLGRLISLQSLSMSRNFLNGTIPVSMGKLAKFHSLDVCGNVLEGVVFEAHFANLSKLKYLDTSSNTKLTLNISPEWIPPFKLIGIHLSSCNIANGFPQWLRNQRKLKILVLSNSSISGPLPTWVQKMPIIPLLDLSHNKLNGPLTNLPNGGNHDLTGDVVTAVLHLQNNFFNGSIPRSLCRRKDLNYLDLSRNMLTGKITECLENMQGLRTMKFSSNRLSGVIPSSIGLNSRLNWLDLNDNNFTGELPCELGNLTKLNVLDLGDNNFSGNIPDWIGENLASLMVLRLDKNNFSGGIPRSLCKTASLQILDVSGNNLTGTIPRCLGQLNAMINSSGVALHRQEIKVDENVNHILKGSDHEYTHTWDIVFNMDLSNNKLVGEIPAELTALNMLVGLNLSCNHLSGSIPNSIGNMSKLESLDFSNNKLIGMIPPSMAALNFLRHLNLSHNNLPGSIRTGNQLQTFTDSSIYAGNEDLCGAPLPKNCSNHEDSTTTIKKRHEESDGQTKVWFYVDVMSGFATGFWGVIGVLLLKKQWRWKLFRLADETMDKIYIVVMVRVAKMKKGRETIQILWNASSF
uniref:Leucine-rich repeat-containing N-terminal plant-type domain-containing protein n=1 Tax=Lactuca sativa TaxID=4236 RepID=A0A9R1UMW2_LACSA|nr:hypothetical protein LSAT_V11C800445340 [Lactuca sativa]